MVFPRSSGWSRSLLLLAALQLCSAASAQVKPSKPEAPGTGVNNLSSASLAELRAAQLDLAYVNGSLENQTDPGSQHVKEAIAAAWTQLQEAQEFTGVATPDTFALPHTATEGLGDALERVLRVLNTTESDASAGSAPNLQNARAHLQDAKDSLRILMTGSLKGSGKSSGFDFAKIAQIFACVFSVGALVLLLLRTRSLRQQQSSIQNEGNTALLSKLGELNGMAAQLETQVSKLPAPAAPAPPSFTPPLPVLPSPSTPPPNPESRARLADSWQMEDMPLPTQHTRNETTLSSPATNPLQTSGPSVSGEPYPPLIPAAPIASTKSRTSSHENQAADERAVGTSISEQREREPAEDRFSKELLDEFSRARQAGEVGIELFRARFAPCVSVECTNLSQRGVAGVTFIFRQAPRASFLVATAPDGRSFLLPQFTTEYSFARGLMEGPYIFPGTEAKDLRLARAGELNRVMEEWELKQRGEFVA